MARAMGRLERPRDRQYDLRSHLMGCYKFGKFDFMAGLSTILQRYQHALAQLTVVRCPGEAVAYYFYPHHDVGWSKARVLATGWLDLGGYQEELMALAEGWGLRCDWAVPWLHACLMEYLSPDFPWVNELSLRPHNGNVDLDSIFETVRRDNLIRVEVRYDPYPPVVRRDPSQDLAKVDWKRDFINARDKVKEDALKQLEDQMDEIDAKYMGRGYVYRDSEPQLWLHIHWLYERLAFKMVPRAIALKYGVGQDAVEEVIRRLARALPVSLPRNRGPSVRRY